LREFGLRDRRAFLKRTFASGLDNVFMVNQGPMHRNARLDSGQAMPLSS